MISSNNEVCRAKVFPDNCMPHSLPRARHAHSKGKECKLTHAIGIFGHDGFVDTYTSIVIDIPGFGETDDRVNENIGLSLTGSPDGKFTVGPVHWVASLEGDNFAPRKLFEVRS